ncbi:hypothetical protein PENTCL1PPCAC_11532 [Pristionchus entomophagus]|uniref:Signal recognition particle 9 kDa protein n=1 Tax=Pristionchus entomophagus TaxID=358040 RepID=A0AAV5T4A9_9BILA|nr:hypothetical protein PENTCL1PPCAC_11532 [Pristionchus entomophagus]
MTYFTVWEDFAKAVERLYAENPEKCRFVTSFRHVDKSLIIKMTDDVVCLQYRTDQLQDVKKLEKLTGTVMKKMITA